LSNNRLAGKTAVVTGGSRGIGWAICDAFIEQGAQVISCGRTQRPNDLRENIDWIEADLSKEKDVEHLFKATQERFNTIDILVNNAGIQIEKNIVDTSNEDWNQLMGVNMYGVFLCCRRFIPSMNLGSSIINIGSVSGKVADPGMALYNASKAFVHGLTRSIAVDHGPNIRCNAISPGWISTEMADQAFAQCENPDNAKTDALSRHAVRRFGQPDDIASLAVWLASDESSFATGQCYTLDGGLTAASAINTNLF